MEIIIQRMDIRIVKILDLYNHLVHRKQIDQMKINEVSDFYFNFDDSLINLNSIENSELQIDEEIENQNAEQLRFNRIANQSKLHYRYIETDNQCVTCVVNN